MRVNIRNLLPTPFDIATTTGIIVLPASGSITVDVSDEYADLLRASPAVKVEQPRGRKPNELRD